MNPARAAATLLALFFCSALPEARAEAYKCADADGNISYQQMPCSEGQQQAIPVDLQPALIDERQAIGTGALPTEAGRSAGRLAEIASHEGGMGLSRVEAWARKPMPFAGGLQQGFAALAAVVVLAIVFFPGLFFWKKPKEKSFTCTRCERLAPHNPRTIDAWRQKKTEFFCDDCHARWLLAHPEHLFSKKRTSR